MAEHINTLQLATLGVESELGLGIKGIYQTLSQRLDTFKTISGTILASAVTCVSPGAATFTDVQGHIDSAGAANVTNANPHGVAWNDIFDTDGDIDRTDKNITTNNLFADTVGVSGNYMGINIYGPDTDSYLYFYNLSLASHKYLKWDDGAGNFEVNSYFQALGDITASGNIMPTDSPTASGSHSIGTVSVAWGAGYFDTLEASTSIYAQAYLGDGSALDGLTFTGLDDTPDAYGAFTASGVRVNAGGDGLEFCDLSSVGGGGSQTLQQVTDLGAVTTHDVSLTSSVTDSPVLKIENTNADATAGILRIEKDSVSPADDDALGNIEFYGNDSVAASTRFARIQATSTDVTHTDEAGSISFDVIQNGTIRSYLSMTADAGTDTGSVRFNSGGIDINFIVSTDDAANMLFIDGGLDFVVINSSTQHNSAVFNVAGSANVRGDLYIQQATPDIIFQDLSCTDEDDNAKLSITATATGTGVEVVDWNFYSQGARGVPGASDIWLKYDCDSHDLQFYGGAFSNYSSSAIETGSTTMQIINANDNLNGAAKVVFGAQTGGVVTYAAIGGEIIADGEMDLTFQTEIGGTITEVMRFDASLLSMVMNSHLHVKAASEHVKLFDSDAADANDFWRMGVNNQEFNLDFWDDSESAYNAFNFSITSTTGEVEIETNSTTTHSLFINCDAATGTTAKSALRIDSENADTAALYITSPVDATGAEYYDDYAVVVVSEGIGGAADFYRDVASASATLVNILDDDATATGAALTVSSAGLGSTVIINANTVTGTTGEAALRIDSEATDTAALYITSAVDGTGANWYDDYALAVQPEDIGGGIEVFRNVASATASLVKIDDTNVETTSKTLYVTSDANATNNNPVVQFATTNAANDQPVLQITQAGTGDALEVSGGNIMPDTSGTLDMGSVAYAFNDAYIDRVHLEADPSSPLEAATKQYVDNNAGGSGSAISGEIKIWSTDTAPVGYLLCDGASVSQTTYATLYAIIGVTFGDPGGGNFNLPDMTGRIPVGLDTGGSRVSNATSIAANSGDEDGVGSHTHVLEHFTGGTSGTPWYSADGTTFYGVENGGHYSDYGPRMRAKAAGSVGGNLPPYLTLNYIIKT